MAKPFEIRVNTDQSLLKVSVGASALAYISVVFNIVVFIVLFRKKILSPATVLMQALAIADCLTSFFAYGLEPLFYVYYKQVYHVQQSNVVELKYPFCRAYVHFHYLSEDFHLVSLMMTTCIGVQKCIAMHFPIWTKCHLKKRMSVYACITCFTIALALNIPRHFGITFLDQLNYFAAQCAVSAGPLIKYALVEHLLISVSISILLCVVMIICTVYIAIKLKTNTFHGRQVMKSKAERRSIIMVFLVLFIFLLSEIPRMLLYVFIWDDTTVILQKSLTEDLVTFLADERFRMAIYTQLSVKMTFDNALILAECRTIFTLVGCISNFIIYVSSSQKMRDELLKIFHIKTGGTSKVMKTNQVRKDKASNFETKNKQTVQEDKASLNNHLTNDKQNIQDDKASTNILEIKEKPVIQEDKASADNLGTKEISTIPEDKASTNNLETKIKPTIGVDKADSNNHETKDKQIIQEDKASTDILEINEKPR